MVPASRIAPGDEPGPGPPVLGTPGGARWVPFPSRTRGAGDAHEAVQRRRGRGCGDDGPPFRLGPGERRRTPDARGSGGNPRRCPGGRPAVGRRPRHRRAERDPVPAAAAGHRRVLGRGRGPAAGGVPRHARQRVRRQGQLGRLPDPRLLRAARLQDRPRRQRLGGDRRGRGRVRRVPRPRPPDRVPHRQRGQRAAAPDRRGHRSRVPAAGRPRRPVGGRRVRPVDPALRRHRPAARRAVRHARRR